MYTAENFRTKKSVMEAVRAGAKVRVYQPGPFNRMRVPGIIGLAAEYGVEIEVTLEGPHYPEPHRWYATALIRDGMIVKIK